MVHVLNKGKAAEREAVKYLQPLVNEVYQSLDMDPPELLRNQLQSAVGGYDIIGLDWLALEIKRQETLQINKWWEQVNRAAAPDQVPVVMFRQNRQKWRFILNTWIHTGGSGHMKVRCEINEVDFKEWFKKTLMYYAKLESESTCI